MLDFGNALYTCDVTGVELTNSMKRPHLRLVEPLSVLTKVAEDQAPRLPEVVAVYRTHVSESARESSIGKVDEMATAKTKLRTQTGEKATEAMSEAASLGQTWEADSPRTPRKLGRPRIHTEELGRINIRVSKDLYALLGQFAAWKRYNSENGAPVSLGQVLLEALESNQEFARFKAQKKSSPHLPQAGG